MNNIEALVSHIETYHIQLCNDYNNFYRICTAFATDMGESGRELARRICIQSENYQKRYREEGRDFDVQYNNCLKNRRGNCHINSVFQMAKEAGVDIKSLSRDSRDNCDSCDSCDTPIQSYTGASVYNNNSTQQNFSSDLNMFNNTQEYNDIQENDYLSENCEPDIVLPDLIKMGDEYIMPEIVRRIVEQQHSPAQKNATFISTLALLAYFVSDKLCFNYDGRDFYSALQVIVCGQAASGKGCITETFALVDYLNNRMFNEYKVAKKKYDDQMYQLSTKGKERSNMPRPECPKYKVAVISPNSSGSATIQALSECDGHCCLLAPELSDIIGSNESEHGGIHNSAAMRMAFDHDKISMTRRTNNEHIVIENPRLTFVGAGTQEQFKRLIGNAENGQFSRAIYIIMPAVKKFENRFGRKINIKEMVYNLGHDWTLMLEERLAKVSKIEFELTEDQSMAMYSEFSILNDRGNSISKDMSPFVFRLLINTKRLMSSLAFIRAMEKWESDECLMTPHPDTNDDNIKDNIITKYKLGISNQDFYWILRMASPLFEHGEHAYSLLEENFAKSNKVRESELVLNKMPYEFSSKEFVAAGKDMGLRPERLRQWLKRFCERGIITSINRGTYQKKAA